MPEEDSEGDDDSDNDDKGEGGEAGDDASSSTSDENDSTAAAHAAAIGHSPKPIRPTIEAPDMRPPIIVTTPTSGADTTSIPHDTKTSGDATDLSKIAAQNIIDSTLDSQVVATTKSMESSPENENAAAKQEAVDTTSPDQQRATTEPSPDEPMHNGEEKDSKKESKKKKRKYYCPHNLNERDQDENTPIHIAIHARKLEHVKLLLEAGANVHKKSDGSAPIHTAISIGALAPHEQFSYDCVVLLSQYDADLTAKDDAMHTPLYLACKYNLTQVARFLLSTESGLSSLNTKADRSGGRPLHAAAKFDISSKASFGGRAGVPVTSPTAATGQPRTAVTHHHPDGTIVSSMHHIPGFPGKLEIAGGHPSSQAQGGEGADAMLTQILLRTTGIEVDAPNTVGQTPLHIACMRGNWIVTRQLLQASADPNITDRRGFTAGQLAHKRGMPIPNDLLTVLGGPPSSGTVAPPRDLIVDPDGSTLMLSHELCVLHRSCPPIIRDSNDEPPPENLRRLHVLIDKDTGILRCGEFGRCAWEGETRRAAMVDILKVRGTF